MSGAKIGTAYYSMLRDEYPSEKSHAGGALIANKSLTVDPELDKALS